MKKILLGTNGVTILALIFCCFFKGDKVEVKKVIEYVDIEVENDVFRTDSTLVTKLGKTIDSLKDLKPRIVYKTNTIFKIVEKDVPLIIGKYRIDTLYRNDTIFIETEKDYSFSKSDKFISYKGKIVEDSLQFEVEAKAFSKTIINLEKRSFLKNNIKVIEMPTNNPYIKLDKDVQFSDSFKKESKKHGVGIFGGIGVDYLARPTIAVGIGYVWKK